MSGGNFYDHSPYSVGDTYGGQWEDVELNEMFYDLFGDGWYGRRSYWGRTHKPEFGRIWKDGDTAGLAETLDLYKSGDIDEKEYREQVNRFKEKWLVRRTPRNRVEFYVREFEDEAAAMLERMKKELSEV